MKPGVFIESLKRKLDLKDTQIAAQLDALRVREQRIKELERELSAVKATLAQMQLKLDELTEKHVPKHKNDEDKALIADILSNEDKPNV